MDTEYADQINSRPVIFFSFKDCKAVTVESLLFDISAVILDEYMKYQTIFDGNIDKTNAFYYQFFMIYEMLLNKTATKDFLKISIVILEKAIYEFIKLNRLCS